MTLTVEELIDQAKKLPPDLNVYLASDEEGNKFHEVTEIALSPMIEEGWDGIEAVHPDDVGTEYDEEDIFQGVVIWP